jgi:exopolysaccharide biosynthesis polyprenyl glycosylphosphotransferase
MSRRFSLSFTLFLFGSDMALVVVALLLATQARLAIPLGKLASPSDRNLPLLVYGFAVAIWSVMFVTLDVYNPRRAARLVNELQIIAVAMGAAFLMLAGVLYFSYRQVSRLQIIYFGVLYLGLVSGHRIAVRGIFKLRGGRSYDSRNVLVVGTGDIARELGRMVRAYAWAGLYLVGFVGDEMVDGDASLGAPLLGSASQTLGLVRQHQISEVVIALPSKAQPDVTQLIYDLQALPVNVRVVPDYFDLAFLQVRVEDFGGMPMLSLKEPSLDPFQRLTKRVFDLVLTPLLLIPVLPLMGVVAVAIKLDSPGPVLFKQERVGEGGRLFGMYKFRSMVADAERRQDEVISTDNDDHILYKHPDDPRVTRVGRFVRRHSLDELPQFFNVLKGEMSLVGPRPEMPWLVDRYEPWQRKRFEVPQGLTGWWQVGGRADKPMHLHTEEDLFYIRNYSLWLDIQILWRTISTVISGRGAF